MITGLRAFVLCGGFERGQDSRMIYRGVVGDEMVFATQPGLLGVHACFEFALDGKATDIEVVVEDPDGSNITSGSIPSGHKSVSMSTPIGLMIKKGGALKVGVRHRGADGWIFQAEWPIRFEPGSRFLTDKERRSFKEFCDLYDAAPAGRA